METVFLNRLKDISELQIDVENEQNIKHNIIIPILECFGFDELILEHAPQGSRIDVNINNLIIVETKSLDKNIDDYIEQLKRYCDAERPILALISNGNEFKIYSPFWRKMKTFQETVIYFFKREQLSNINLITRLEEVLSKKSLDLLEENVQKREKELMSIFDLQKKDRIEKKSNIEEIENKVTSLEVEILEKQKLVIEKKEEIQNIKTTIKKNELDIKISNYLPYYKILKKTSKKVEPSIIEIDKNANYILNDKKRNLIAEGFFTEQGHFIVTANSEFTASVSDDFHKLNSPLTKRNYLIENNILSLSNDKYYLLENHEFNSISQAASVILGRSTNGKIAFKKK